MLKRKFCLILSLVLISLSDFAPAADPAPSAAVAKQLLLKDLEGISGKEALMLTVYLSSGRLLPAAPDDDAQVFVYVLEGELIMQVQGGPKVTLRPGDTFYESPTDVHAISANASQTAPAKFLVFILKDKGVATTRPAP